MISVIKVDRVCSLEEAKSFEALGATHISVALNPDPRFEDERSVSRDSARSIKQGLRKAKLVGELDFTLEPSRAVDMAIGVGFDAVQPSGTHIPSQDIRNTLSRQGIGLIYANIEVAHDDDPSWILSRYDDEGELNCIFFQVDLLPEYRNSWDVLRNESPDYEDEIQIEDIKQLSSIHDIVVITDYTPDNILEIAEALPEAMGVALVLGSKPTRSDARCFDPAQALEILRTLRHAKSS